MVCSWHQEITSLFALFRPNVAICCELIVSTRELVLWILVDIELLTLLRSFHLITLEKHFDFEAQVKLVGVSSDSQEVEAMLLVNGVFDVVEVSLVNFEEFIILGIIGKFDCFLELFGKNLL